MPPPTHTRAAQAFKRSTTKYWVRNEDVSTVKHHVLQGIDSHKQLLALCIKR